MSYDVNLCDEDGAVIMLPERHQITGGTYALGGTREAWLNITYNYSKFFYEVIPGGLRGLYGKTGADAIPLLDGAIVALGNELPTDNYWNATSGNARRALENLRELCKLAPHGILNGD